jgi:TRAP-type C4-dicarboxylate transport system permease small subunit
MQCHDEKRPVKNMRRWIQKATFWLSNLGMVLLIPMMLLTTGEVIGRAVWSKPIPGSMELSSYMLAVFVLLGIAYTHQVKGHVRVSMLVSRLSGRVQAAIEVVTTLLSLCIVGIVAWQGWVLAMEEKAVSDMLRIPQAPFKFLVFVAGVALCVEVLLDLSDAIKKLVGR